MKRTHILVTVVLALAVVAGGVFWFRQGGENIGKSDKKPVEQGGEVTKKFQPVEGEDGWVWFPVPELGIEIKAKKDIAPELLYQVKEKKIESDTTISAQFTTKRLIDIGKNNDVDTLDRDGNYTCYAGYFIRYNVGQDDFLKTEKYEFERNHGAIVDGTPVSYFSAQSGCSSEKDDMEYESYVFTSWWGKPTRDYKQPFSLQEILRESIRGIK